MIGVMLLMHLCTASPDVTAPAVTTVASDEMSPDDKVFGPGDPPDAPTRAAPWVKSPFIFLVQLIAGLGFRSLLLPLMPLPIVGPVAMLLVGPWLEAIGVTWSGDRVGDGRGPLLGPLAASMLVGGGGSLVTLATNVVMIGSLAGILLFTVPGLFPSGSTLLGALPGPVIALGATGFVLVLAATVLVHGVGLLLLLASPLASTAAYQGLKRRKDPDDNGTGFIGLLPSFSSKPRAEPAK